MLDGITLMTKTNKAKEVAEVQKPDNEVNAIVD